MKHKLLIVDDEEEVRKVIRLQLSGTRHEVLEAIDGEEGIAVLQSNPLEIETVICDVRMPKINGVEAVAYFRREFPKTPVIVLTGYPDVDLAVEFLKQGVAEYLVKPVEKEKLLETVEKAVSQRTLFAGEGGIQAGLQYRRRQKSRPPEKQACDLILARGKTTAPKAVPIARAVAAATRRSPAHGN